MNPPFAKLVLLPFHIMYQIGKAFFFNIMKEVIEKWKINVWVRGRCREGFIVQITRHPFNKFNKNDNLHSIRYYFNVQQY